jgi:pyruvate/2-oxoglutarate dehydrogenase complex dihydrolipoamide dehydrogenase (E3) component
MIRNLDDAKQVEGYRADGIDIYKSDARIAGSGAVEVGETTLSTERIIVATGSEPAAPPIEGLAEAGFWTNREATTLKELAARQHRDPRWRSRRDRARTVL